ncbi:hypothetical protein AC480_01040 [miscellaneous Crenarchaeota group archaeon SMTZ1-55]|nr:MAG: hypothetical protein AC480_01040 [miscellaneous Crenarchaeota group archaeon SMTZ1-55]
MEQQKAIEERTKELDEQEKRLSTRIKEIVKRGERFLTKTRPHPAKTPSRDAKGNGQIEIRGAAVSGNLDSQADPRLNKCQSCILVNREYNQLRNCIYCE